MAREKERIGVVVVDVQGDFTQFKKGSLAVAGTDEAFIKALHESTETLKRAGFPIYATQDWHPPDHVSFYTNHPGKKPFEQIRIDGRTQILWPPHCVQRRAGARLLLDSTLFSAVIKKGKDPRFDSYSGFQDDGGKRTDLDRTLRKDGITKLLVYGIATDYCVRATALDAVVLDYEVILVESLCRGVAAETTEKAIREMMGKGIQILKHLDFRKIKG